MKLPDWELIRRCRLRISDCRSDLLFLIDTNNLTALEGNLNRLSKDNSDEPTVAR